MITLAILIVLEAILLGYIITRILRYRAAPTPTLRAAMLTAVSLLVAMFAVTEPVEVLLRGPDSVTVGMPTLLKHLGILGCAAGVLLMGLAQRRVQRPWTETVVWIWLALSAGTVIVLDLVAGGGGNQTSVEFVMWSHSQPALVAAMMIAYLGGLVASLGFVAVIWPLNLRSSAGRGLAIMAVGALLSACWCVLRIAYVAQALQEENPDGGDLLITQIVSVIGLFLINVGLVWSTAEADVVALIHWQRFRGLHRRVVDVLPEVQRSSDLRLGLDTWVSDRAVEVLDALHQIDRASTGQTGFPQPPDTVSAGDVTKAVAGVGRQYGTGGS